MSYIQIVTPDGLTRGLKFNMWAIHEFISKIDSKRYEATANYAMVWAGLTGNCFVKETEPEFTFEDVCEWVDNMDQKQLDDISIVFADTQAFKTRFNIGVPDDKKKVGRKLKKTTGT